MPRRAGRAALSVAAFSPEIAINIVAEPYFSFLSSANTRNSLRRASVLDFS